MAYVKGCPSAFCLAAGRRKAALGSEHAVRRTAVNDRMRAPAALRPAVGGAHLGLGRDNWLLSEVGVRACARGQSTAIRRLSVNCRWARPIEGAQQRWEDRGRAYPWNPSVLKALRGTPLSGVQSPSLTTLDSSAAVAAIGNSKHLLAGSRWRSEACLGSLLIRSGRCSTASLLHPVPRDLGRLLDECEQRDPQIV
jgi:hypothetical protein